MRKVAVSLAAVMMVLASFATPSFAAGDSSTYNGTQFSGSITAPTVVKAGATLTARGTITLNTDESAARKNVAYRLAFDGLGQSRSGVRDMATGRTRSVAKSFVIPARIEPGEYTVSLYISVNGENAVLQHTFRVEK
jgi:hypothetical protein